MSTILDALKRLEVDRRKENARQAPSSMMGSAMPPPMARRRGTVLIVAGLVTIGVVVALVWVNQEMPGKALSRKEPIPDPIAGVTPPDATKKPASAALRHQNGPEESDRMAKADFPLASRNPVAHERARVQAPASRQTVLPKYSEQFKANRLSMESTPDRTVTTVQGREQAAAVDQKVLPRTAKPKPVIASLPETSNAQASANQDPYAEADSLARGTLKLQAISWSDIPSARITVIDGRILREGHSVEGYTVIQIRPEDIIVGKEGKRWKLAYHRP